MSGSYNFLLHLLGFGMLMALYVRGAIFERTFRAEPDWNRKALILNLGNTANWLGAISGIVLLLTGFGNIYNRYLGSTEEVEIEGWIIGKILFFLVFVINGATFGRILAKRRFKFVQEWGRSKPSDAEERKLRRYNRWMVLFYVSQGLLLLWILYMAAFGSAKHPGVF